MRRFHSRTGTLNIKRSKIDRKPRKCECGECSSYFIPWQERQRFFNAQHKARWHKAQGRKTEAS